MRTRGIRTGAVAAIAALTFVAAACGDDSNSGATTAAAPTTAAPTTAAADSATTTAPETTESMGAEPTSGDEMSAEPAGAAMALEPSGPACSSVPADGEGSFVGMADDPAATAASNNPELTTLVETVTAANLVDTLNGEGPFTIFAPVNSAFAKIPSADLEAVLADPSGALTDILTLHVVAGEAMDAEALVTAGTATNVAEGELTIAADGDTVTVDAGGGPATVVCANVPVANGVVHLIDTVLLPAS